MLILKQKKQYFYNENVKKEEKKSNKKVKFLSKNWFKFLVLILLIYLIFFGKININFSISEGFIGLFGVILGFVLWTIYDYYKEKKTRKKLFLALKNELIMNSILITNDILSMNMNYKEIRKLRIVNFEELERTGSFVGLPGDLQRDIYDTYTSIISVKKDALSNVPIIMEISKINKKIKELINYLDQYTKKI